ncbi:hypothetical protein P153DRAFT_369340 [Dothidotthia symphoricarpi CBS 119687]|uniref:magnesium chelatase n=1 Tax=Dothidotthia symphoricarpi CBS 119687 TaxID=1392245 RepID=A0A6A6A670_9PLEO|nr:uncharacterized protein P153DRAFT_369340 [Dothidotthia symphoricarpi CBS 119687]KAF2126675.1 hypothetical protein P153DRAFT_369340 [Dothidotthia symphoricarpi CBS 119687]
MAEDPGDPLTAKVQALSDIELAVLICLVADQHCIVEAEKDAIDDVQQELQLVATRVFGLTCAVLNCDEHTTLDDFGRGILVEEERGDYFGERGVRARDEVSSSFSGSPKNAAFTSPRSFTPLEGRRIANVVVVKNLNLASSHVQIQALELIRGKRNFTRTAVHAAPRPFLLIALNALGGARLTLHLCDQFFISHKHHVDDGYPNLEDVMAEDGGVFEDDASASSVVRRSSYVMKKREAPAVLMSTEDIAHLTALMGEVKISSEIQAYLHNVVVFMRLHRAVAGGISATATRHLSILAHALAPLHGLNYITPSLVALAARKIYPHRITITTPENERSMQWGSSLDAVKAVLDGVTVEDVIEEVLQSIEEPL